MSRRAVTDIPLLAEFHENCPYAQETVMVEEPLLSYPSVETI
jgi:hypothetical protein